jgi:hypothetical protein
MNGKSKQVFYIGDATNTKMWSENLNIRHRLNWCKCENNIKMDNK